MFCLACTEFAVFAYPNLFYLFLSPRGQLLQLKKEKLEYIPGEHEYGLLPAPIHVGVFVQAFFMDTSHTSHIVLF